MIFQMAGVVWHMFTFITWNKDLDLKISTESKIVQNQKFKNKSINNINFKFLYTKFNIKPNYDIFWEGSPENYTAIHKKLSQINN